MKIAIISEFRMNNLNYGNNLQTFALYHSIKSIDEGYKVDVLLIHKFKKRRCFYIASTMRKGYQIVKNTIESKRKDKDLSCLNRRRLVFEHFQRERSQLTYKELDWNSLVSSDYDAFVVGSDLVWAQDIFTVNRVKFLDFDTVINAKKIAYAASFGRDWIAPWNKGFIRKCLSRFNGISVREKSSLELLHSIKIDNAVHALDPTLLYPKEKWVLLEKVPYGMSFSNLNQSFLFAYILGDDEKQRIAIDKICKELGLTLVTVPYAAGKRVEADFSFGDIQLWDCSPEEWIWLVHHADYVITDSFHGVVFSTIFEKKFFAVKRHYTTDINNRIIDYLDTIGQKDKFIDLLNINLPGDFQWNYTEINRLLNERRKFSQRFLKNSLQEK